MLPIIGMLFIYALTSKYRSTVSLFLFFLIGTCMFQIGSNYFIEWDLSKEMKIIVNRILLLFIIGGLLLSILLSKQKVFLFASLPDWQKRIVMPYHSIKLTYFLLFRLIGSATIFVPLLFVED